MRKLDGIKIAKKIAEEKGGKCLSSEYVNRRTKMLWQCSIGHKWRATLGSIKNGNRWCLKCSGLEKLSIDIAKNIAKNRNGQCLSNKYINSVSKILWKCKLDHKWFADLNKVKNRNQWCPTCAMAKVYNNNKLDGINIAQRIAKNRNGICLSKKYNKISEKLLWKCEKNHKWSATLNDVKNNDSWCPECGYLKGAKKSNNSYILYHWKTGEELVCKASYEKLVVEYLNKNKINFRWQPKTFKTALITVNGKPKTYRPDLYLVSKNKWVEIKGYFWPSAKEKWKWFHKKYCNSELWNKEKLEQLRIL